jgi:putative NADH-flavin reductase
MRITIIGASRGVGRAAVDTALAAGHDVVAFARNAGTLATTAARVVAGDVLDPAAVRNALQGANAVIVALGVTPGKRGSTQEDICSRGTRTVLVEMRAAAIERIVVVTSYGVGPTQPLTPFPFSLIAKTLLKGIMADKEAQEREVRASGLAWTIVQPLGLTDEPASGRVTTSTDGARSSNRVSRADVAAVCVDAIGNGAFIGASVAVSAIR